MSWQRLARLITASAALAAACASARADSAPARRVAVVAVDPSGGAAAKRLVDASAALRAPGVVIIGDGVALARRARADGAVAAAQLAEVAQVIAAGAEGWRAYLQVAVPFAASRLAKARSDAEALLPLPGGKELYADLSLRLGAVLLALGRTDEAQEALALSGVLDATREVSLVEFSPDIVEALAKARSAARPAVPLTLSVGPDVHVEIDGAPQPAPRHREIMVSLPRGQHVIVARRAGHLPFARALRLDAETRLTIELVEDRAASALARGAWGLAEDGAVALAEAVVTFADADETLWLARTARRGAPALLAQRCDAVARCTAIVEVGYEEPGLPAALRAAWSALGRGELRYPPSLPQDRRISPIKAPTADDKCRICRSPWLWAGVGATVLASAALIAALVADDPTPVLVVDPGSF